MWLKAFSAFRKDIIFHLGPINVLKQSAEKACLKNRLVYLAAKAQRKFLSGNTVLQQTNSDLDVLSNLTDYVNRQLFLYTPEDPKEKPITTTQLLNDCQSVDDVLDLIENMHRSNLLWKDELLLYHNALISFTNAIADTTKQEMTVKYILNHEKFHILLQKTATASIYMFSNHLAEFLYCAGCLAIPKDSFIINYTIEVIKKRINDFFPKDVVVCHAALQNYKFGSKPMQVLQRGLEMHLKNTAKDEEFFVHSSSDAHFSIVSNIAKYFGNNASPELKNSVIAAIEESYTLRKKKQIEFDVEAGVTVLNTLANIQCSHKELINKSVGAVFSGSKKLTCEQAILLQHSLENFKLFMFKEDVKHLEHLTSNIHERISAE